MIVTASSGPHRYTRGNATLTYEFTIVPPPEDHGGFPAFSIPGPECLVDVMAIADGRVQTNGGVILVGDPLPGFIVVAEWSLRDDLGVEVFRDGIGVPLTSISGINDVFSDAELLTLKANHAYRVTMHVNAEAAATTLPASATAIVHPVFIFAEGTTQGHSFRSSGGIGNTTEFPVPEPDTVPLLGAGLIAIGLLRRRRRGRDELRASDGGAPRSHREFGKCLSSADSTSGLLDEIRSDRSRSLRRGDRSSHRAPEERRRSRLADILLRNCWLVDEAMDQYVAAIRQLEQRLSMN